MEENHDTIKLSYTKNLTGQNFATTITLPIDSNVNIKTILGIDCCLFDEAVECGNGKAIINGKLGVKVVYVDTDNITNTISTSQPFSEAILDNGITADSQIVLTNISCVNSVLSKDANLKINCELNMTPVLYLNLALSNNLTNIENMIVKKSEIKTTSISGVVKTNFDHTLNFEFKQPISKVLSINNEIVIETTTAKDGFVIVDGKIYSSLLYEVNDGDDNSIKELNEISNFKTDIEINGLNSEDLTDLYFTTNNFSTQITTEQEDDATIVSAVSQIKVNGVILRPVSIDLVDDLYSTDNEISLSSSNREYVKDLTKNSMTENVYGEISLADDETAIEDIVSNLNICPDITNQYVKDGQLYVEGIITSQIIYIDENKEYKNKNAELPFVINTKIEMSESTCVHPSISIMSCKHKARRGTIIELEYEVMLRLSCFEKCEKEIIDNLTIGKPLDFSNVDFQIFIARPNESMWDICKRIKISPETLTMYNKNLPLVMEGGEKIIVKR
ncbi:MAG: DUF3794 domain-containing protein [Candidatus Onthoplasma sp.]